MRGIQPYETKTLLVTVKTYPTPSAKYIETTCVSGITDDGHWIRLHPVHFHSLREAHQFRRYSWIRVRVNKATRDGRPESYHLDPESVEILRVVPTTNEWQERRAIVDPMLSRSVEDLWDQQEAHHTSLGVIRPKCIKCLSIEPTEHHWLPEQLAKLDQQDLFSRRELPRLEKIPFRVRYEFSCDDTRCKGHEMQVFDWEVAQSFRRWRWGKMREEWEEQFRDMYDYQVRHVFDSLFFLGTLAKYPKNWIIGGIFFAPRKRPQTPQTSSSQLSLW